MAGRYVNRLSLDWVCMQISAISSTAIIQRSLGQFIFIFGEAWSCRPNMSKYYESSSLIEQLFYPTFSGIEVAEGDISDSVDAASVGDEGYSNEIFRIINRRRLFRVSQVKSEPYSWWVEPKNGPIILDYFENFLYIRYRDWIWEGSDRGNIWSLPFHQYHLFTCLKTAPGAKQQAQLQKGNAQPVAAMAVCWFISHRRNARLAKEPEKRTVSQTRESILAVTSVGEPDGQDISKPQRLVFTNGST